MAEKMAEQENIGPDEVFILVKFNQKDGKVAVNSNTGNQIQMLGMLTMAEQLVSKPKESKIVSPGGLKYPVPQA